MLDTPYPSEANRRDERSKPVQTYTASFNVDAPILCWTRMQTEAGQSLDAIVARKETERRLGDGLFFWGVGNAPAVATSLLARMGVKVPVVFSVMKSKPKRKDTAPERVLAWCEYIDKDGILRTVPDHVLVTSRASTRPYHFALVCYSSTPLVLGDYGSFDHRAYRNVSEVGKPVGASQVTAILRRCRQDRRADYRINLEANLCDSYWVKLVTPVEVPKKIVRLMDAAATQGTSWRSVLQTLKRPVAAYTRLCLQQTELFSN